MGCDRNQAPDSVQISTTPGSSSPSPEMIMGPVNYLALGDSTGVGVGARDGGYVARLFRRIAEHRAGSRVTNLCVSGATTSDVLRSQLDRGVRAQPNLVTLGIGINDVGMGYSADEFAQNYDAILSGLKKTSATIVITNIPDISSAPRIPAFAREQYHQQIVEFNRRLAEIASRHGVIVFDIYSITHQELPSHPEYFSYDGFHPSDAGYELWANQMWPLIAKLINVEP